MDWLFDEFEQRNYMNNSSALVQEPGWEPKKWDLMIRFVMAFRHGYGGIVYNGSYTHLQDRLEEMFENKHVVRSIHYAPLGHTVIYPVMPTNKKIWSFQTSNHTLMVDYFFRSEDGMRARKRLMHEIRHYVAPLCTLYTNAFFICSTRDLGLIGE